jgi:hypothetical protein
MEKPRNYLISDVTLNWVRLDKPQNPFGTEQYETQIETRDPAKAKELEANHLNVKEKEKGIFTVSLKRKAKRADGSDNGKVEVVGTKTSDVIDVRSIGNGSQGNVIVWQYPYDAAGRQGIATSLTKIQITDLQVYTNNSIDFDMEDDSGFAEVASKVKETVAADASDATPESLGF